MEEITHLYRERHYSHNDRFCKWFERCPVVKKSLRFVTVRSQTYSTISYPGGDFRIPIESLLAAGYHHHTRHGERFWLEQPEQGDLFPTQQLLDTRSALDYEAIAMGWDMDRPLHELEEWQRWCYFISAQSKQSLRMVVDRWKFGGQSAIDEMIQEVVADRQRWLMELINKDEQ